MKLLLKITFLILLLSASITYIHAQTSITTGIIRNQVDATPIENAHIINLQTNKGVISKANGTFKIEAKQKDTLLISIIGFKTTRFCILNRNNIIYLEKETYKLRTFNVLPYKNFKEFKTAFLNLNLPDTSIKINQSIFLSKQELLSFDGSSGVTGAISALLGHFNKYVQDKKHFKELIKADKYKAFISKKFNPQLIARITKIKDSFVIDDFKKYCDFSNHFIEFASTYELSKHIIDCYKEYKNLPTASK